MDLTLAEQNAARVRYADDPLRAAYFWEIVLPSGLVMREFTPEGADVPMRIEAEPPYQLWARPYHPARMPVSSIMIRPGGSMIWEHRATFWPEKKITTEALLFGTLRPVGELTEVARISHKGDTQVFTGTDGEAVLQRARQVYDAA